MLPLNTVHPENVMAWVGIIDQQVIGPFFFDDYVNQYTYAQMIEEYVLPELENRGIDPKTVIYMHDGAPPHRPIFIQELLNRHFLGFIGFGQDAILNWPPRSPDLNPLDFFLWGFVKDMVYQRRSRSIRVLRRKIEEALDNITHEMLLNVQIGVEFRLQFCTDNDGRHIEHLL